VQLVAGVVDHLDGRVELALLRVERRHRRRQLRPEDQVLADYGLETLEAAAAALGADLGFEIPRPIPVDILRGSRELVCQKCQAPLRLIALVRNQDIAKRILTAMHLSTEVPELHPARPPPGCDREGQDAEEWVN